MEKILGTKIFNIIYLPVVRYGPTYNSLTLSVQR
jgi:hypothetical protein